MSKITYLDQLCTKQLLKPHKCFYPKTGVYPPPTIRYRRVLTMESTNEIFHNKQLSLHTLWMVPYCIVILFLKTTGNKRTF